MNILEKIIAKKHAEVREQISRVPVSVLEKSLQFNSPVHSLRKSLLDPHRNGIIAEFKRQSPSKGIINSTSNPEIVCKEYITAGASAVSVLTDKEFFGGSIDDLIKVRNVLSGPILRKDFIIDEYQIIEARSAGADAILLILEVHDGKKIKQLHNFAISLGMEVLIELHDITKISGLPADAKIVGINSRDLNSFDVDTDNLLKLIEKLPSNVVKVAESGIKTVSDYQKLKNAGFNAYLIGEQFMKSDDPGKTCRKFISDIRSISTFLD